MDTKNLLSKEDEQKITAFIVQRLEPAIKRLVDAANLYLEKEIGAQIAVDIKWAYSKIENKDKE